MKIVSILLVAFVGFNVSAQEIQVDVSGSIFNIEGDSIYISQFYGDHYIDQIGAKLGKNGEFELNGVLPAQDYYVLRFDKSHINLILRDNSSIKVYGDGSNINQFANIIGSDESMRMNEYLRVEMAWKSLIDSANATIKRDPSQTATVNQQMKQEQMKFQGQIKSFIGQNRNSPALLAVLSSINRDADFKGYEGVVKQLMAGFGDSPTVQSLYKEYIVIRDEKLANDPLAPGKPAPDFKELMPSGDSLALSDLQGKVVLLDFWASWCGPCRKENPHVVHAYEKYKEDGFTVMSVSLDKDRERWLQAIEQDGLIWPNHVSDLKYWSSRAAKAYGVSSIPFTVLIDQEGKIVGTRLRGPQLEAELSRIFGH